MATDHFKSRHLGPRNSDHKEMLKAIGVSSLNELIDKTIPAHIRLETELDVSAGMREQDYLEMLANLAAENKQFESYIGMGYYPTVIPSVIQRNVLENPGWYTAYTPYQAEIAQGRLEALLNFQTMCSDLTGMELANASLLDEGTAAAEAMIMFWNNRSRAKQNEGANRFFVDQEVFPQTKAIISARAKHLGIEIETGHWEDFKVAENVFGALIQYPNNVGEICDYRGFTDKIHAVEGKVVVASDLMALSLINPPGEWGADAVVGNSQRFGVPMGFGGPHAAFFATKEDYKRHIPGRIIGVSQDRFGKVGYRMALQTREQHIRRDKATSNICTAQALLAVMAGMYAVYHGPDGIRSIAEDIHEKTSSLAQLLGDLGHEVLSHNYFDTLLVEVGSNLGEIKSNALASNINLRYFEDSGRIGISINETTSEEKLSALIQVFGGSAYQMKDAQAIGTFRRKSKFLTHPVFHSYRSETELMRYLKKLENRDMSLVHSMIALGSCTMKLNAASELMPITWPEFANIHPFAPKDQLDGYMKIIEDLEKDLSEITGFAGMSLQPNSGAQGEYAGLLVIRAYHESRGEQHRDICLIPSSAHGTNPASAVMAGMKVVVVKCDDRGNVDLEDLREKATAHSGNLGAFMITYPSTHGVFEERITEINEIIHEHGGQVYMDGANMNAQVGLTSPGNIGADVCHLNLHKTFAIPHGGGGPGMGPIGVAKHLLPFLPDNPVVKTGGDQSMGAISSAPWGSALILLISYGYIKMLGAEGMTESTKVAILNANYIKAKLAGYYDVLYTGKSGTVAHEMIVDCRSFKTFHVEVEDIAKRLMDYGFHAPTVSFPVAGTMMIEPTESESKEELDRFCHAMISIRQEIQKVESGEFDESDNPLQMAPHPAHEVCSNDWNHKYSRQEAVYPLPYLEEAKFWVPVGRIDNAFGDRNLMCVCPPMEMYMEQENTEVLNS